MTLEVFIFAILLLMLIVAIVRKVLYLGLVVLVLAIAYYTGVAHAAIDFFLNVIAPLIPEGSEWVNILPLPTFLQ